MRGRGAKVQMKGRRLIGRQQAVAYLGVTTRTLDRLSDRGLLRPIRLPGLRRVFFDRVDLDALVDAGKA
jgi:hypothetical protein